jgi:hypothetical protein
LSNLFAFDGSQIVGPSSRVLGLAPLPPPNPTLDAQIIHRPPESSFAQQAPRTPLAHNLYPDLKLQPTETASLENIPISWFMLNMVRIPIASAAKATQGHGFAPCRIQRK